MTDHAAETAMSYLAATVIDTHGDDDRKVAIAQVHATLALVEEQRTANLIAALAGNVVLAHEEHTRLVAEIIARLGLTPTTPGSES